MRLATINMVWIGPELGPIHVACLRSFLRHGHRLVLHCYEPPADLPEGVELADARAVMAEDRIFRHESTGRYAPFADLFRYELLASAPGLYVDCDVYCLAPIADSDYILGWETTRHINCAVLKLPPDCPILADLRAMKEPGFWPPWLPRPRKRRWRLRRSARQTPRLDQWPQTTFGPQALTHYTQAHGLDDRAAPIDVFYPVSPNQVPLLVDPELRLEDVTTHRTRALHLYHNQLTRHLGDRRVPEGSVLDSIVKEGAGARRVLAQDPVRSARSKI